MQDYNNREHIINISRKEGDKDDSGGDVKYKKKGSKRKKLVVGIIFLIVVFYSFNVIAVKLSENDSGFFRNISLITQIKHLAESSSKELIGENDDRINILLLGVGGGGHQGGTLADTIILVGLKLSTGQVSMVSFPRDLSVPIEGRGRGKINSVNAYAEVKEKNSGGLATAQTLEGLLDISIPYYARVDFQAFEDLVDEFGGIKVYVDYPLDDYSYPVNGNEDNEDWDSRFEHLHIEKGWNEMDGSLALKYVRSRHSSGIQGSDFARAKRQQKVIEAVKDKFRDSSFIFKPSLVTGILQNLNENISTNLEIWEIMRLWNLVKNVDRNKISNEVLSDSPNSLLTSMVSTSTGYILYPRAGNFSEVQYLVNNVFMGNEQKLEKVSANRDVKVEIKNGTWINGLAGKLSIDLERSGFEVIRVGNSEEKGFEKTVIYDLSFGENIEPLKYLKEKMNASVKFNLPDWLKENIKNDLKDVENPQNPDFLIILGTNVSHRK